MARHKLLDETEVPSGWGQDAAQDTAAETAPPEPDLLPEPQVEVEEIPPSIPLEPDPAAGVVQAAPLQAERESFWAQHQRKQQEQAQVLNRELTLEESALNILNQLDSRYKDEILRIAHNRRCASWMVLAGIVLRLGDQGLLSETELDTSWLRADYNGVGHSWSPPQPTICAGGAHHFLPSRKGQRFCCTECAQRHGGDKHQSKLHGDDCSVNRVGVQGTLVKETSAAA